MERTLGLIAAAGFTAALVVHLLTFAHIDLSEGFPFVWSLHIGIFLVFLPFVFLARKSFGADITLTKVRASVPQWASTFIIIAIVYAFVNFALFFFLSEGGRPDVRDGQFVLQNHGKLIRFLTEEEYHLQRAYVLRGFSGHWLVFYLVPAVYFLFGPKPNPPIHSTAESDN
jgi:hypothetical protein